MHADMITKFINSIAMCPLQSPVLRTWESPRESPKANAVFDHKLTTLFIKY